MDSLKKKTILTLIANNFFSIINTSKIKAYIDLSVRDDSKYIVSYIVRYIETKIQPSYIAQKVIFKLWRPYCN